MTGSDTTSCTQNCKAGELLVYASPNTMLFDGCCELSCECSTLPDINLGIWGAYSDLVTTPDNRIFASAYNETFGDLVVVEYDSTGTVKAVDFVDGIPTSGTAVANPAGPRNGLQDGGPNVGTHTAIATDGTSLFVAYHDEDTHRLKFAVRELATKNWNVSYITDQSEGDVGYYSSIALEGSTPHLSYYAHRIPGSPISTGVYYAVPNQSAPTSPDNWTKTPIETYQGCGQACGESKECVGMDQGPACQTPSSSCPSACGCDEICVGTTCRPKRPEFIDLACPSGCGDEQECVLNDGVPSCGSLDATCEDCTDPQFACVTNAQGQPSCLEIIAVSTLRDLPQGVGLFSSIAIVSGEPHIVYYDRFNKSLRGASGLGNFSPVALACQDKTTIDADLDVDVGQQSTIVPNTNRDSMAILYQLDAGRQLRTLLAADMATAQITLPETSDNGERIGQNSPKRFVGAYVDGVYQNDRLFIAYQDQTQNDLVINTRETGHWRTPVAVLSEGAYGRYANIAVFGEKLVVSTYRYEFDENSSNQSGLVVQVIDPAQYFTIE